MDTFTIVLNIFAAGMYLLAIYQLLKLLYVALRCAQFRLRRQKDHPASSKIEALGISPRQIFTVQRIGFLLFSLSMAVAVGGYVHEGGKTLQLLVHDFYANVATSLASLALTVLIIDRIYESQRNRELKMQLLREMSSRDNGIALRAVVESRAHGWLEDGSLRGIQLENANLQHADLSRADLRKAYFYHTNLSNVNFAHAKLQGATFLATDLHDANLFEANLEGVNSRYGDQILVSLMDDILKHAFRLLGATMPDGSMYNGRFNLAGDFYIVKEWSSRELDIKSPQDMSQFYGVSIESYLHGQEWASKNLKIESKNENGQDKNTLDQTLTPTKGRSGIQTAFLLVALAILSSWLTSIVGWPFYRRSKR